MSDHELTRHETLVRETLLCLSESGADLTAASESVVEDYSDDSGGSWISCRCGAQFQTEEAAVDHLTGLFKRKLQTGRPDRISFSVTRMMTDYESFRNPLYFAAKNRLTSDYLDLVREVQAVNPDADRVEPIYLDRRGNMPEVIEVVGLDSDETHLPLRTVGYEVETREPEQLEPAHDADDTVTWIRITNGKAIEKSEVED